MLMLVIKFIGNLAVKCHKQHANSLLMVATQ